jgi:hypothetical protein
MIPCTGHMIYALAAPADVALDLAGMSRRLVGGLQPFFTPPLQGLDEAASPHASPRYTFLAEPVRHDVRSGDQKTARRSPVILELALTSGRGFRADQWWNSLSMARS